MKSLVGKTILLTGATGFIGSHLLARLRELPLEKLVCLARSRTPLHDRANEVWVNCSLEQLTSQMWSDKGIDRIDAVIHLGGFIPKRSDEGNSVEPVYRANLLGTRALLDSLPNVPDNIVFASTVDVYAPVEDGNALTENSAIGPSSLYGASKLFCEHLLNAYALKNACCSVVLRYGHIYGPGEEAYVKLIPQTIRALLRGDPPVVIGTGKAQRDFIFVGDAVEATMRSICLADKVSGPVNIVSGESRSVGEYVQLLARLAGYTGALKTIAECMEPRSLLFINDKMFSVLGRWQLTPLEEGMKQELSHFKSLA